MFTLFVRNYCLHSHIYRFPLIYSWLDRISLALLIFNVLFTCLRYHQQKILFSVTNILFFIYSLLSLLNLKISTLSTILSIIVLILFTLIIIIRQFEYTKLLETVLFTIATTLYLLNLLIF